MTAIIVSKHGSVHKDDVKSISVTSPNRGLIAGILKVIWISVIIVAMAVTGQSIPVSGHLLFIPYALAVALSVSLSGLIYYAIGLILFSLYCRLVGWSVAFQMQDGSVLNWNGLRKREILTIQEQFI